jgi:WD40 repeat protein
LYQSRILLAQQAWRLNDPGRVGELLTECHAPQRGWEWHYLNRLAGLSDRSLETRKLRPHTGSVSDLAFSPDGRWVVSGSSDHKVIIHDLAGKEPVRKLGELDDAVRCVAFSPRGVQVAAGSGDPQTPQKEGRLTVWDWPSGHARISLAVPGGAVRSVTFSPDGKQIAAGCGGPSTASHVHFWDADTGKLLRTFREEGGVHQVAYSPDGKRLALAAGAAGVVIVWDVETGGEPRRLSPGSDHVRCLAFGRDGRQLYTAGTARVVKCWDVDSGDLHATFGRHLGDIRALALSPDGNRVVSSSADRPLQLWITAAGLEILPLDGPTDLGEAIALSNTGLIALGGREGTVTLWNGTPQDP